MQSPTGLIRQVSTLRSNIPTSKSSRSRQLSAPFGALLFAVCLAYVPGALDAAESGRWWLLSLGIPIALFFVSVRLTLGHALGLTLLAWAAFSMLWTTSRYDGMQELWFFALICGTFIFAAELDDLRPLYIGLGVGLAINGFLAVAQTFGFAGIEQIIPPAGTFMNKNYLAEPAALTLVALVGYRIWWLAAAILPAVLLPDSRGALVAIGVAAVAWLWRRYPTLAYILLMLMVAAAVRLFDSSSMTERIDIWRDTIAGLTIFGHGIGSFFTAFPMHANHQDLLIGRPAHAHNDLLELAFELGIPGVLLLICMIVSALRSRVSVEHAVLLAFMTEAFFGFPIHNPVTAMLFAIVAGRLCGTRPALFTFLGWWGIRVRARAMGR